jgi:hypothetical protein
MLHEFSSLVQIDIYMAVGWWCVHIWLEEYYSLSLYFMTVFKVKVQHPRIKHVIFLIDWICLTKTIKEKSYI